MESLVQSLLKMAQLDAGAISLEQSPENLSELLEHIKGQYSFRAGQEGKEINLEGDEQSVLLCDRAWLTEAIGNLVKNALDHTAQGDRILVRWQQSPCLTQITVEDTGSGIQAEDLYHIFKRFYRSRFSKDTQGIGRALMTRSSLVLAGEPTGNLDSQNSNEVLALLKETARQYEQTVIMITHNPSIAHTADWVFQVSDGVLTDLGGCRK